MIGTSFYGALPDPASVPRRGPSIELPGEGRDTNSHHRNDSRRAANRSISVDALNGLSLQKPTTPDDVVFIL